MSQNSPMSLRGTRFFAFWFFLASAPLRPRIHSVKRFRIRFWIRWDNWLFKLLPGDFYFAEFDSAGSDNPPLLYPYTSNTTLLLYIQYIRTSSALCNTWKVYSSAIHAGLPSHITWPLSYLSYWTRLVAVSYSTWRDPNGLGYWGGWAWSLTDRKVLRGRRSFLSLSWMAILYM